VDIDWAVIVTIVIVVVIMRVGRFIGFVLVWRRGGVFEFENATEGDGLARWVGAFIEEGSDSGFQPEADIENRISAGDDLDIGGSEFVTMFAAAGLHEHGDGGIWGGEFFDDAAERGDGGNEREGTLGLWSRDGRSGSAITGGERGGQEQACGDEGEGDERSRSVWAGNGEWAEW
jgi:hypothetical protein